MARPLALSASIATPSGAVRAGAAAGVLLALAALTLWPLAVVIAHGALSPGAWPVALAARTAVVAVASTLLVMIPAVPLAATILRVDVPGRRTIWRTFRLAGLIPPFIAPLALLALAGPHGVLLPDALGGSLAAIVAGQALAYLPSAVVLAARALAAIPVELEQAAEVLGARRLTVVRRVTLALVGPRLVSAALGVLGLCLSDVASPLLLGGDRSLLSTAVVAAAGLGPENAARSALTLGVLAAGAALGGAVWRQAGFAAVGLPALPRLDRPARPAARRIAAAIGWAAVVALIAPLTIVVAVSLGHWSALGAGAVLGESVLLGLGAALVGVTLAVTTSRLVERRGGAMGRAAALLARVPAIGPGLVAAVGYATATGAPTTGPAALGMAVLIVAAWELPATARVAGAALVGADRSLEDAAASLGASGATTLRRIVAPALRPVAVPVAAHLFAAGVLAVGTVVVLTGVRPGLGAISLLTLATAGDAGAACAFAAALVALAGGALVLGRAIGARRLDPTMLA